MNIVGIVSFFAKIMPVSAMKTCFQIAERSYSYAKLHFSSERCKELLENV